MAASHAESHAARSNNRRPVPSPWGQLPITRPAFDETEVKNLQRCLESGWVTQGPLVRAFEQLFAQRHQAQYALATTSCTAGLHLVALALGLGPGDEVIVPAFTWVTSAHCAEYVGAKVVFADICADSFNLDPAAFSAAITPRTRAVVVVHLFGQAARLKEILAIAKRHAVAVIEDSACAVGTEYDGGPVGNFGDAGVFSFHPRKVITTGEGGMVTSKEETVATKIKSLRNHGATGLPAPSKDSNRPYTMGTFDLLGFNLRMSDIQAAVGLAQMEKLDELLAERRARAERYHGLLADIRDIALPLAPEKCGHTYQSYVIRILEGGTSRRNLLMDELEVCGIQTRPGTHAVHRLGYYRDKYELRPGQFPVAAEAEDHSITLPIFPKMTDNQQDFVVESLRYALTRRLGNVRAA